MKRDGPSNNKAHFYTRTVMTLALSSYPSTKKGAEEILEVARDRIVRLWKRRRVTKRTDDLVAIIDGVKNCVHMKTRVSAYNQVASQSEKHDLLPRLRQPAPSHPGGVVIWALIGFADGRVCILPFTVARS